MNMKHVIQSNSPACSRETTVYSKDTELHTCKSLAGDWNSFPHCSKDLHCPLKFYFGISLTKRLQLETPFIALESLKCYAIHWSTNNPIYQLCGGAFHIKSFLIILNPPPEPTFYKDLHIVFWCLLQLFICLVPPPDVCFS